MAYVLMAAIAAAGYIALAYVLVRQNRAMQREAARERALLVNQVCALSGKPWQEPPSDADFNERLLREQLERYERAADLVMSPEQMVDSYV